MKTWQKGTPINLEVEKFTIGDDPKYDLELASYDIIGSMAHVKMLEESEIVSPDESSSILNELKSLYVLSKENKLKIEPGIEDIHSQIEKILTDKLGDAAKKIHTARSRNDQVLLDLKLYAREQIEEIAFRAKNLFDILIQLSETHKDDLMPGYTHLQVAMPSSFGLWFGAFAESLTDDLQILLSAHKIVNQNPLGSAAGYGSSFDIKREVTTKLLGFDDMAYNSIYAQMGRSKNEKIVAFALSSLASTLSKLSMDITLFMSQNFNFINFPEEFTTGSSIMPHKYNPDVFELIRAKCNKIQALPNQISLISGNLSTGYHRDYQLLKEDYMESFKTLKDCLDLTLLMLNNIIIKKGLLEDEKYKFTFTVEEINKKVLSGTPFRKAYEEVAQSVRDNTFKPDKTISHTHKGSIGNLCNENIQAKMNNVLKEFPFKKINSAIQSLLC
ncbi:MAG: argininosuccinate lyase [Bacteroidales bacterium]|nr:argininosuccinate lyase [Bacteroidales bacterium]